MISNMMYRAFITLSLLCFCSVYANVDLGNHSPEINLKPCNTMAELVEKQMLPAVVNISTTQFSAKEDPQRDDMEKFLSIFLAETLMCQNKKGKNIPWVQDL